MSSLNHVWCIDLTSEDELKDEEFQYHIDDFLRQKVLNALEAKKKKQLLQNDLNSDNNETNNNINDINNDNNESDNNNNDINNDNIESNNNNINDVNNYNDNDDDECIIVSSDDEQESTHNPAAIVPTKSELVEVSDEEKTVLGNDSGTSSPSRTSVTADNYSPHDEEDDDIETNKTQWCVCERKYESKNTVMCMKCSDWYHVECVANERAIASYQADPKRGLNDEFTCQLCNGDKKLIHKFEANIRERYKNKNHLPFGLKVQQATTSEAAKRYRSLSSEYEDFDNNDEPLSLDSSDDDDSCDEYEREKTNETAKVPVAASSKTQSKTEEEKLEVLKNKVKHVSTIKVVENLKPKHRMRNMFASSATALNADNRTPIKRLSSCLINPSSPKKKTEFDPREMRKLKDLSKKVAHENSNSNMERRKRKNKLIKIKKVQTNNIQINHESISKKLFDDFRKRLIGVPELKVVDEELIALTDQIEKEFKTQLDHQTMLRKLRDFRLNLINKNNKTFFRKILEGQIKPEELPKMNSDDMKDDEIKERERIEREQEIEGLEKYTKECREAELRQAQNRIDKLESMGVKPIGIDQAPKPVLDSKDSCSSTDRYNRDSQTESGKTLTEQKEMNPSSTSKLTPKSAVVAKKSPSDIDLKGTEPTTSKQANQPTSVVQSDKPKQLQPNIIKQNLSKSNPGVSLSSNESQKPSTTKNPPTKPTDLNKSKQTTADSNLNKTTTTVDSKASSTNSSKTTSTTKESVLNSETNSKTVKTDAVKTTSEQVKPQLNKNIESKSTNSDSNKKLTDIGSNKQVESSTNGRELSTDSSRLKDDSKSAQVQNDTSKITEKPKISTTSSSETIHSTTNDNSNKKSTQFEAKDNQNQALNEISKNSTSVTNKAPVSKIQTQNVQRPIPAPIKIQSSLNQNYAAESANSVELLTPVSGTVISTDKIKLTPLNVPSFNNQISKSPSNESLTKSSCSPTLAHVSTKPSTLAARSQLSPPVTPQISVATSNDSSLDIGILEALKSASGVVQSSDSNEDIPMVPARVLTSEQCLKTTAPTTNNDTPSTSKSSKTMGVATSPREHIWGGHIRLLNDIQASVEAYKICEVVNKQMSETNFLLDQIKEKLTHQKTLITERVKTDKQHIIHNIWQHALTNPANYAAIEFKEDKINFRKSYLIINNKPTTAMSNHDAFLKTFERLLQQSSDNVFMRVLLPTSLQDLVENIYVVALRRKDGLNSQQIDQNLFDKHRIPVVRDHDQLIGLIVYKSSSTSSTLDPRKTAPIKRKLEEDQSSPNSTPNTNDGQSPSPGQDEAKRQKIDKAPINRDPRINRQLPEIDNKIINVDPTSASASSSSTSVISIISSSSITSPTSSSASSTIGKAIRQNLLQISNEVKNQSNILGDVINEEIISIANEVVSKSKTSTSAVDEIAINTPANEAEQAKPKTTKDKEDGEVTETDDKSEASCEDTNKNELSSYERLDQCLKEIESSNFAKEVRLTIKANLEETSYLKDITQSEREKLAARYGSTLPDLVSVILNSGKNDIPNKINSNPDSTITSEQVILRREDESYETEKTTLKRTIQSRDSSNSDVSDDDNDADLNRFFTYQNEPSRSSNNTNYQRKFSSSNYNNTRHHYYNSSRRYYQK